MKTTLDKCRTVFGILTFLLLLARISAFGQDSTAAGSESLGANLGMTAAMPLDSLDFLETGLHRFSLRSPYETVVTHLYFLQDKHWFPDSAAMTLNIANPAGAEAREKAIMLKQFLDGSGYFIDVDALPRNPNYTDTVSGLQKYILTAAEPDIFLYKKPRGWVYSWTTVQAIDRLHARVFPFGTMKWLPQWSQQPFLGIRLWQFLGVLLFVLFTILLHKLLTNLLGGLLESILQRYVKKDRALKFFNKVARPISLLILFSVLDVFYPALQFSGEFNKWVVNGFRVAIPVYQMLIALQVVNLFMAYFEQRAKSSASTLDDQLVPMIRNLLKGVVVIAAVIYIMNRLAVDVTALIGGVAFGTLAFALAAQDTIKNLFGSVVIFLDRPFQIGDWVIIGEHEGVVEEVSVRSTRIRTFGNSLISIPNGNIASAAINNMGARVYRRFVTRVNLHYTTPPPLIELFVEGVRELVRQHPGTRKEAFEVHFETMADNSLQVLIYVFFAVPSWTQELEGRQTLLLSVLELAKRLNVSFAFPKQVININPASEEAANLEPEPLNLEAMKAEMVLFLEENKQRLSQQKVRSEVQIGGSDVDSDSGHANV
jgi:MscS family membrane protein